MTTSDESIVAVVADHGESRIGPLDEVELERAVELAARRADAKDGILNLRDADTDCPKDLSPKLLLRATDARGDRAIRVVLAKMEYEAWFLAAAASVAGRHGIHSSAAPPPDAELIRNAKGWLSNGCRPDGLTARRFISHRLLRSSIRTRLGPRPRSRSSGGT